MFFVRDAGGHLSLSVRTAACRDNPRQPEDRTQTILGPWLVVSIQNQTTSSLSLQSQIALCAGHACTSRAMWNTLRSIEYYTTHQTQKGKPHGQLDETSWRLHDTTSSCCMNDEMDFGFRLAFNGRIFMLRETRRHPAILSTVSWWFSFPFQTRTLRPPTIRTTQPKLSMYSTRQ